MSFFLERSFPAFACCGIFYGPFSCGSILINVHTCQLANMMMQQRRSYLRGPGRTDLLHQRFSVCPTPAAPGPPGAPLPFLQDLTGRLQDAPCAHLQSLVSPSLQLVAGSCFREGALTDEEVLFATSVFAAAWATPLRSDRVATLSPVLGQMLLSAADPASLLPLQPVILLPTAEPNAGSESQAGRWSLRAFHTQPGGMAARLHNSIPGAHATLGPLFSPAQGDASLYSLLPNRANSEANQNAVFAATTLVLLTQVHTPPLRVCQRKNRRCASYFTP